MKADTDVLIVGGGPAGLAAAIALRQRGIACVVVEAQSAGMDKACGEGLMPGTRRLLGTLGVDVMQADGYAFHGLRFVDARHSVEARFADGMGLGVRRPRLHRLLAERAEALGAEVRWRSRVELVDCASAKVNGAAIRFRWLVGADGHASTVRRWAQLDETRKESLRFGFRRHYEVKPWSDSVEVHWGPEGQFYVTPVAAGCVCAVYLSRQRQMDRDGILREFPELAQRLEGAAIVSQQRGAVSATKKLRRVANDKVALIGDASGSADSITGEGLAMAFEQAQALGDALASGSLAGYEAAHRRIARLPHALGRVLLTMDRYPALQVRALRALSMNPEVFTGLLAVHGGGHSGMRLALRNGPRLGWSLVRSAG